MRTFATAVCVSALLFVGCAGEEEAEMDDMGEMEPAGEVMEEEGMAPDTAMMMDTTM
nr:hypothetical protein [Gemmatimonadota bacterium]NIR35558.1 hypothetical protein [Actinomycetota bacterium]NIU73307.1 hypothetical protein [Gammaproteobacteria bacterium]NIY07746.1 hypothetical protein [Gemmatimonadota bacterium]